MKISKKGGFLRVVLLLFLGIQFLIQVSAQSSVDAIAVYGNDSDYIFYSFFGDTPSGKKWWSLGRGIDNPYEALSSRPGSLPSIAFSPDNSAVAVWGESYIKGPIMCRPSDRPEYEVNLTESNLVYRIWNGGVWETEKIVVNSGTSLADRTENTYYGPTLAIDSNGKGLLAWVHQKDVYNDACNETNTTFRIKYALWNGNDFEGDSVLYDFLAPGKLQTGPNVAFTTKTTDVSNAITPHTALVAWYSYVDTRSKSCQLPDGSSFPFQHDNFWVRHALWNGGGWENAGELIPERPPIDENLTGNLTGIFLTGNKKPGISSDQLDQTKVVFGIERSQGDPCIMDPSDPNFFTINEEVWSAKRNVTGWKHNATQFDTGNNPDITFLQDNNAVSLYSNQTQSIKWSFEELTGNWENKGEIGSGGGPIRGPVVAALEDRALSVWIEVPTVEDSSNEIVWSKYTLDNTWTSQAYLAPGKPFNASAPDLATTPKKKKIYVIFVIIDGMPHDVFNNFVAAHPDSNIAKTLSKKSIEFTRGAVSVFPSYTFPNQVSLITGRWPGGKNGHKIFGNTMFDRLGDLGSHYQGFSGRTIDVREYDLGNIGGLLVTQLLDVYFLNIQKALRKDIGLLAHFIYSNLEAKISPRFPKPKAHDLIGLLNQDFHGQSMYLYTKNKDIKSLVVFHMTSQDADGWIVPSQNSMSIYTGEIHPLERDRWRPPGRFGVSQDYDLITSNSLLLYLNGQNPDNQPLSSGQFPQLLTLYLGGIDHMSHLHGRAWMPQYTEKVIDPIIGDVSNKLKQLGIFDNVIWIYASDHGHVEVHDSDNEGHDDYINIYGNNHALIKMFQEIKCGLDLCYDNFYDTITEVSRKNADVDAYAMHNGGGGLHIYLSSRDLLFPNKWDLPPSLRSDVLPFVRGIARNATDPNGLLFGKLDDILIKTGVGGKYEYWVYRETPGSPGENPDCHTDFIFGLPLCSLSRLNPQYVDAIKRIKNFATRNSPDIILLPNIQANDGWPRPTNYLHVPGGDIHTYYFDRQSQKATHGSLYESDSAPALYIGSGGNKGASRLNELIKSEKELKVAKRATNIDIAPTILHLFDIPRTRKQPHGFVEKLFDGISIFENDEFKSELRSPGKLHLYDIYGNHTGPLPNGTVERQVPFSDYRVKSNGTQEITVLYSEDSYRIVIEGNETGNITLSIIRKQSDEYNEHEFLFIPISNTTNATFELNDTILKVDEDGDGSIDRNVTGNNSVVIEDVGETVTISINSLPNRTLVIDAGSIDTFLIIDINYSTLVNGKINITRRFEGLTQNNLFFLGKTIVVNISGDVDSSLGRKEIILSYTDTELQTSQLAEKTLSIYFYNTTSSSWQNIGSILDIESNTLFARFMNFPITNLTIAGTDLVPRVEFINVTPSITNSTNINISLQVNATDNGAITSVNATINGINYSLSLNSTTGFYETTFSSPSSDGEYLVEVTALDNNDNIGTDFSLFVIDTTPPQIIFIFPQENQTINETDINAILLLDELPSLLNYSLDNKPFLSLNTTTDIVVESTNNGGGIMAGFINLTNLTNGGHTLFIRIADFLNNTGFYSVNFSVNVTNVTGIACGSLITQNTNLAQDLTTTESCLDILSDNIILDCQNHAITGTGGIGNGIMAVNRNNVTIRNCFMRDFNFNILFQNTTNSTISNNKGTTRGDGIRLENSNSNKLFNNNETSTENRGIALHSSHNNILINNTGKSTTFIGIAVGFTSNNNLFQNNTGISEGNSGIEIHTGAFNTLIENTGMSNRSIGIKLGSSNYSNFTYNKGVSISGVGIQISGIGNRVEHNTALGINRYGLDHTGGSKTILRNNTIHSFKGRAAALSLVSEVIFEDNRITSEEFTALSIGSIFDTNITRNIIKSSLKGMEMYHSQRNLLRDNIIVNNSFGIELVNSTENLIYNNFFNNSINARDDSLNFWNITKTLGVNIIGGPFLGGNFWHDYQGSDINGDGIGDTLLPYNSTHNITNGGDFLPLAVFVDDDRDRTSNSADNCPTTFNPDQSNIDSDIQGDVCDPCPNNATNTCDPSESVAANINASGGAVITASGNASVTIPVNALASDTSISIGGSSSISGTSTTAFKVQTSASPLSLIYSFNPAGTVFNQSVTITLGYDDTGINESTIDIYLFNSTSGLWEPQGATCNTILNECSLNVSHFSDFIVGGFADIDGDGVLDKDDVCLGSVLDNIILNPNQYAQNINFGQFEVGPNNQQSIVYNMKVSKGCTCGQIVNVLNAGEGHLKKGCSPSLMENWTGVSAQPDRGRG